MTQISGKTHGTVKTKTNTSHSSAMDLVSVSIQKSDEYGDLSSESAYSQDYLQIINNEKEEELNRTKKRRMAY